MNVDVLALCSDTSIYSEDVFFNCAQPVFLPLDVELRFAFLKQAMQSTCSTMKDFLKNHDVIERAFAAVSLDAHKIGYHLPLKALQAEWNRSIEQFDMIKKQMENQRHQLAIDTAPGVLALTPLHQVLQLYNQLVLQHVEDVTTHGLRGAQDTDIKSSVLKKLEELHQEQVHQSVSQELQTHLDSLNLNASNITTSRQLDAHLRELKLCQLRAAWFQTTMTSNEIEVAAQRLESEFAAHVLSHVEETYMGAPVSQMRGLLCRIQQVENRGKSTATTARCTELKNKITTRLTTEKHVIDDWKTELHQLQEAFKHEHRLVDLDGITECLPLVYSMDPVAAEELEQLEVQVQTVLKQTQIQLTELRRIAEQVSALTSISQDKKDRTLLLINDIVHSCDPEYTAYLEDDKIAAENSVNRLPVTSAQNAPHVLPRANDESDLQQQLLQVAINRYKLEQIAAAASAHLDLEFDDLALKETALISYSQSHLLQSLLTTSTDQLLVAFVFVNDALQATTPLLIGQQAELEIALDILQKYGLLLNSSIIDLPIINTEAEHVCQKYNLMPFFGIVQAVRS